MRRVTRVVGGVLLLLAIAAPAAADEPYGSSVVGTDFDFITDDDPSAFLCLEFKFRGTREMPDKRGPTPLFQEAFVFVAYFEDGTQTDMALHVDFEMQAKARAEAMRYATRLGKLPTSLRRGVERLIVHPGGADTTAFGGHGAIILYAGNATKRIGTHDLEETLFHESVHAAWDEAHAGSSEWRAAQDKDGAFITRYARKHPHGEDLAESALFAYTLLHHPGRIPPADAARIRSLIPARIAFVERLVPPGKPIFFQVAPRYACDGSGKTFTVDAEPGEWAPDEEPPAEPAKTHAKAVCTVDITRVGTLSDIVSNALYGGLGQKESEVRAFLTAVTPECDTPEQLLAAVSKRFAIDRATLDDAVQEFLHCNCDHGPIEATAPTTVAETPASPATVEAPAASPVEGDDGAPILYVIAGLLLALLIVNTITLVVLMRRGPGS